MTAYLILFVEEIIDPEEMATYGRKARRAGKTSAVPLVVYGDKRVMEGPDFEGVAMLAFSDIAEAQAWYESAGYQEALPHRLRGAKSRLVIVQGIDAPSNAAPPVSEGGDVV